MNEQDIQQRVDASEEQARTLAERKALIAQMLDRGLVNDRLEVKGADPNYHYSWVREHDVDIERMKALGYEIVREEGEGLHKTGDNLRRIGDVILMRTPRDNYEVIQAVKDERKAAKSTLGKKEYLKRAKKHGVPVLDPLGVDEED